jgi:hypothetical protein
MGANTCLSYVVPLKVEWGKNKETKERKERNEDRNNTRTFL